MMTEQELEERMNQELRELAFKTRIQFKLSQREMGLQLDLTEQTYADFEAGRIPCDALTCILLMKIQDDPNAVVRATAQKVRDWAAEQEKEET